MAMGSFFAVTDTTAMFRALRSLKVNNRALVGRRFLSVSPNDPIKTYSRSEMCDWQNNEGNSSLHIAIISPLDLNKRKEILSLLFFKGFANPFIENNQKRTPRQEAELRKDLESAKMLEEWEDIYYKLVSEDDNKSRFE